MHESATTTGKAQAVRTDELPHDHRRARRPANSTRLRRSRTDRVAGGVCGGVARFIGCSSTTLRALTVVSLVLTAGFGLFVYGFLMLLLPLDAQADPPGGTDAAR